MPAIPDSREPPAGLFRIRHRGVAGAGFRPGGALPFSCPDVAGVTNGANPNGLHRWAERREFSIIVTNASASETIRHRL